MEDVQEGGVTMTSTLDNAAIEALRAAAKAAASKRWALYCAEVDEETLGQLDACDDCGKCAACECLRGER